MQQHSLIEASSEWHNGEKWLRLRDSSGWVVKTEPVVEGRPLWAGVGWKRGPTRQQELIMKWVRTVPDLDTQFAQMDTNRDGQLSPAELIAAVTPYVGGWPEIGGLPSALMQLGDFTGDGFLSFDEFKQLTLRMRLVLGLDRGQGGGFREPGNPIVPQHRISRETIWLKDTRRITPHSGFGFIPAQTLQVMTGAELAAAHKETYGAGACCDRCKREFKTGGGIWQIYHGSNIYVPAWGQIMKFLDLCEDCGSPSALEELEKARLPLKTPATHAAPAHF